MIKNESGSELWSKIESVSELWSDSRSKLESGSELCSRIESGSPFFFDHNSYYNSHPKSILSEFWYKLCL